MLTDPGNVERHLGTELSAAQLMEADALCLAADAWILATYGISDTAGPVTEQHYDLAPVIFLNRRPIASVTSVSLRSGITATPVALVAGTDYEIADLALGAISLPGYRWGWPRNYGYDRATVVYTPDASVSPAVELAATMLVCHWLRRQTEGVVPGVQSYSVGQELSVTYSDLATAHGVPAEVTRLLAPVARIAFA